MRYVLDTSILVAGLRSREGASAAVLRLVLAGELVVVSHHKLFWEYEAVLNRADNLRAIGRSRREVERFIAALYAVSERVDVSYLWRPNLRDEADNFVFEIAVAASPCCIVTHNSRDFAGGDLTWPTVIVQRPSDVLEQFYE